MGQTTFQKKWGANEREFATANADRRMRLQSTWVTNALRHFDLDELDTAKRSIKRAQEIAGVDLSARFAAIITDRIVREASGDIPEFDESIKLLKLLNEIDAIDIQRAISESFASDELQRWLRRSINAGSFRIWELVNELKCHRCDVSEEVMAAFERVLPDVAPKRPSVLQKAINTGLAEPV
ncbi:hypothetical protein Poly51_35070 [Rubripirellula tenax]|uniref:Uncharacterized protein n=2 Tax=Rubripirellula tenax TaxID=2528015 RepID=A0A5C6F076_9BACT|nr:hypothetical protein Poly51_35070 [Rubripirellula tenax]